MRGKEIQKYKKKKSERGIMREKRNRQTHPEREREREREREKMSINAGQKSETDPT